jgi:hypothetical protein
MKLFNNKYYFDEEALKNYNFYNYVNYYDRTKQIFYFGEYRGNIIFGSSCTTISNEYAGSITDTASCNDQAWTYCEVPKAANPWWWW